MQEVSNLFKEQALSNFRPIGWGCSISFEKTFNENITFFTIGSSLIEGGDIIKGENSEVVQEWDKYDYTDYTNRVINISVTRQVTKFGSVTLSLADVVLNNYDDYFTPGKGSAIDGNILPYRPIRLYMGFGSEVIPVFIGLTTTMPRINEKDKTVSFTCIDFIESIQNRSLDESVLYQNQRTDQILESLLIAVGLTSLQLDFDTGLNTITYAYFPKGTTLGVAFTKLIEAEQGRLYMDEYGTIKFRTRDNYNDDIQYNFNAYDSIIENTINAEEEIVNVVEIKGKAREELDNQKYWESAEVITLLAGESVDIWADFDDPVTSVDDPEYITGKTTSLFSVNTASDGSGSDDAYSVKLSSTTRFAQSFKMTFKNNSGNTRYITNIQLFCQPVRVVQDIYIRETNETSVGKYDERVLTIENEFIQNESDAKSIAQIILGEYADFGQLGTLDVKGSPALQIDDAIRVNLFDNIELYRIRKIVDMISFPVRHRQIITVKKLPDYTYFEINTSVIAGPDVIRP